MKKKTIAFLASIILITSPIFGLTDIKADASNYELKERMRGRLLLQVEEKGEVWYVHPDELKRYYLGRPSDAFNIMREKAIGISNRDFNGLGGDKKAKLSGRIIIKAEDKGQAYYIDPVDLKMHYLGRPADAFKIMCELSTGIKNSDLDKIEPASASLLAVIAPVLTVEKEPVSANMPKAENSSRSETGMIASEIFDQINNYRISRGQQALKISGAISRVCEDLSQDMAGGRASFSHDGFDSRAKEIKEQMDVYDIAENIAWNYGYSDPASQTVDQWLKSPGHKKNIDGNYAYTGIGAAKSADGKYYFTQIFVR